jgi:hypothetical protein
MRAKQTSIFPNEGQFMHDVESILKGAFTQGLADLQQTYWRLIRLDPGARTQIVTAANVALAEVQAIIALPETVQARNVLLQFQFLTRFSFGSGREREFVEPLGRCCPSKKYEILRWAQIRPTHSEFTSVALEYLACAGLWNQTQALCNEKHGVKFPLEGESFDSWVSRVGIVTQPGKSWCDTAIARERQRWFTSTKRIAELEQQQLAQDSHEAAYAEQLRPLFPHLSASKLKLEALGVRESDLSIECETLNKVANAISQGVQLKHLLLEEAAELDQFYRAATRGL